MQEVHVYIINKIEMPTIRYRQFIAVLLLMRVRRGTTAQNAECSVRLNSHLCLPVGYEKERLPQEVNPIHVESWSLDIPKIDDVEMQISLRMYLASSWRDPRIISNVTLADDDGASAERIGMSLSLLDRVWKPDLFIYNLTNFREMRVLEPLSAFSYYTDGRLLHYATSEIQVSCKMDFSDFPMDTQICIFAVGSSNYVESQVRTFYFFLRTYNLQRHRLTCSSTKF